MGRVRKEGAGTIVLKKRECMEWQEQIKLPTPASWDNGIKTDVNVDCMFLSCHVHVSE